MIADSPEYRLFLAAYAARKAPLTLFLGAGLSRPAGLLDWAKLEKMLNKDVKDKVRTSNQFGEILYRSSYTALQASSDIWMRMKFIKSILGEPTFNGLIDQYLSISDEAEIPSGYINLVSLEPQGVVSLNLDRFAGDAVTSYGQKFSSPIYGKELGDKWNYQVARRKHIVYLHGDILNPSTWVLDKDDLDSILSSDAHKLFLQEKYFSNLVLFVGISADDMALSQRLIELRGSSVRPPNLFWLTSRSESGLQKWADDHYVKLIRYQAKGDDEHSAAIKEFVEKCVSFRPQELRADPVANSKYQATESIDALELSRRDPDTIRKYLTAKISEIIQSSSINDIYERYRDFCKEYHFAIHQAFYRNGDESFRTWFDYRLDFPAIGRGNFGEVYSSVSKNGDPIAIKIMNEAAFQSDEMLGGFRRGVRSMKLVNDSDVSGMVPLIEAYELPPTIVMPFINGVSLQEALESRDDISWETKLKIARKVATIVSSAHALASTVLHRDLKPSNIMVENFEYIGDFDPDVKVLDFDMSWHKGSQEKDVVFESRDDFGFLSPEQTGAVTSYHAQTTKVDSYGFGMTIYFMFGGKAPLANEPLSPGWGAKVMQGVARNYNYDWVSAPNRLARVIVNATKFDQKERMDFFKLKLHLEVIEHSITNVNMVRDVDVWGEELLARVKTQMKYLWDDDYGFGSIASPSGVTLKVSGDPKNQVINVKFDYNDIGMNERSNLPRFLRQHLDMATRELRQAGWEKVVGSVLMGGLTLSGQISVEVLANSVGAIKSVSDVYNMLQK